MGCATWNTPFLYVPASFSLFQPLVLFSVFLLFSSNGKHRPPAFPHSRHMPSSWVAVVRLQAALRVCNALNIQKNRMTRKTAIELFVARFLLFPRFVAPIVCEKQTKNRRGSSLRKKFPLATPKARTFQFNVSRGTFT